MREKSVLQTNLQHKKLTIQEFDLIISGFAGWQFIAQVRSCLRIGFMNKKWSVDRDKTFSVYMSKSRRTVDI